PWWRLDGDERGVRVAVASEVVQGLDVVVVRELGTVLVRPEGDLEAATSPRLALVLATLLGDGCTAVVLDLVGLLSLDVAGAWLIGEASRLFRNRGGEVVVRSPHGPVRRALHAADLAWLIETPRQARIAPVPG